MFRKLEGIADTARKQTKPPVVGIVLGLSHLPLVKKVGEPLTPEESTRTEEQVAKLISPAALAVVALRNNADLSPHVDRALLCDYTEAVFRREHEAAVTFQAKAKRSQDSDVKSHLEAVDQTIKDTNHEWELQPRLARTLSDLFLQS